MQCHAGFAHPARTRQRDEAHILTQELVQDSRYFLLPSNERSEFDGQMIWQRHYDTYPFLLLA
jgi:hypothetical protein